VGEKMTDIATALASVKTAIDLAKLLKNSSTTFAEAEQKLKLAELIEALADVKMEMAEVQGLLIGKNTKISELEESLKTKALLQYEDPYYWKVNDDQKDGPFCQQCYDTEGKLIHLQSGSKGFWHCRTCKSSYKDKDYSPRTSSRHVISRGIHHANN
jgi:ribosomal protein L37AE/L43A